MSTAFRVGILIVMALVFLCIGVFLIGNKDFLFSSTYRLKAEFQNVAGLNTGAPVRIGGIHEGTVKEIVLPSQPDGKVTVVPVHQTAMFIQAGAFTDAANASRLQVRLASLGRAQIVPATVGNQKFYRVRIGPIGTVADADALLDRVVASGHPEARLIVD